MRCAHAVACLAGLAALASCEGSAPPAKTGRASPPASPQALLDARLQQARRELDRSFVVFATPSVQIGELEAPVAPPVTVGSRPGADTMTSDAPQVVSVDADGKLVAHRDGTARIRAAGSSSSLTVVVRTRGRAGGVGRTASAR